MKTLLLSSALLLNGLLAQAQTQANHWDFEPSHCKIRFSVAHFGISETEGEFHKFSGTIAPTAKADFADAAVTFTIDVSSIDTDDAQRDAHLKSADFFDAAKYPTMEYKGRLVKGRTPRDYKLVGTLTMHGVSKPLTLNVLYGGTIAKDPFGNTKAGFKATGALNRKDWGLTWNKALDAGGVAVGDEVALVCNIELIQK